MDGASLHIGCQTALVPGRDIAEKLDALEALGFDNAEISGGGSVWLEENTQRISGAFPGRKLYCSCVCCCDDCGDLGWAEPAAWKRYADSVTRVIACAGEIGARTVIMCPARRRIELPFPEIRARLLGDVLPPVLECASRHGVYVVLEPLNRGETEFLRQVADGAAIARDARHPRACVMGDFWHMGFEETSDMGAFVSAGKYLRHVHIASRRTRSIPGCDGGCDNYASGFAGLVSVGYGEAVSIEAGFPEGADSDSQRKALLARAVRLIREQWDEAYSRFSGVTAL